MSDCIIELHEWSPDDHGGGFACISVDATIYSEKELDQLIMALMKKRRGLRKQLKRACMDTYE